MHGTIGDNNDIRLSIGPFNEFKYYVGMATVFSFNGYYTTSGPHYETVDSLTPSSAVILFDYSYLVDNYSAEIPAGTTFAGWDISDPPTTVIYTGGQVIQPEEFPSAVVQLYPIFTSILCFKEDTKILTYNASINKEEYVPIQNIKVGTMIKTFKSGYIPVNRIGTGKMLNFNDNKRIGRRMYRCSTEKYPELFEDLYISGYHSILVDSLTTEQTNKCIKIHKKPLITEDMYRLPAYIDERTEPYIYKGIINIWHIALDNKNIKGN